MALTFTPTFKHLAWRDGADRVEAEGPNGFNRRFQQIEADLAALGTLIGQIGAALEALGTPPAAQPVTITLTPALVAVGDPWQHEFGAAVKPASATGASGMMPVVLPQGARVRALRATGQKTSGNLVISLRRQPLAATAAHERVVAVNPLNGQFEANVEVGDPALARVDNERFRYFLTAELDTASPTSPVKISSFGIVCVPA